MQDENARFGLPQDEVIETPDQRTARLRAKAVAIAAKETEEADLVAFVAEEKARLSGAELPSDTSAFAPVYDHVEIYRGQTKNDLSYVPLSIGGFMIKVPRGEKVILPHEFTEVLDHAVEEITVQSQGGLITRPAHRFPFSVLGQATPEEYKAFQQEQRAKAAMQIAAAA
ncbi:MAG: hypothetical protein DDT20_00684 [Firmicutes bacterium]|nr:hypothetical protein [Bacillota bacterium]